MWVELLSITVIFLQRKKLEGCKISSRFFISLYLILTNQTSPSNLLDHSQYSVRKTRLHESQMMFPYSPVELFAP